MDKSAVRLVLISDTHELHREIDPIPSGDILIVAGDFSFFAQSEAAIRDFDIWLGELPHLHKIVVLGNHEAGIVTGAGAAKSLIQNGMVLWDEVVEVMGLRLWGVAPPHHAEDISGWDYPKGGAQYDAIPKNLDILITHEPPYGILDAVPPIGHHTGSRNLYDAVRRARPRLHIFGHIHAGYGWFQTSATTFVNAALMGPEGELANRPVVLQIAPHGGGTAS